MGLFFATWLLRQLFFQGRVWIENFWTLFVAFEYRWMTKPKNWFGPWHTSRLKLLIVTLTCFFSCINLSVYKLLIFWKLRSIRTYWHCSVHGYLGKPKVPITDVCSDNSRLWLLRLCNKAGCLWSGKVQFDSFFLRGNWLFSLRWKLGRLKVLQSYFHSAQRSFRAMPCVVVLMEWKCQKVLSATASFKHIYFQQNLFHFFQVLGSFRHVKDDSIQKVNEFNCYLLGNPRGLKSPKLMSSFQISWFKLIFP